MSTAFSRRPRSRRGSAYLSCLTLVVICAGIAGANVVTARGWQGETSTALHRERALQLAESAVDWGVARMRARHGVPPTAAETGAIAGAGSWSVSFRGGAENEADDDGDGATDEADEERFNVVTGTGESGRVRRTVRALLRNPVKILGFDAAAVVNVDAPILDVNGNAFSVRGAEHLIDGTPDVTRPEKWGISSPADPDDLLAQIPSNRFGRITGRGADPSIGQSTPLDLNALIEESLAATTVQLAPGTYSNRNFGTPEPGGVVVVAVDGDLHLSGGTIGAGILVVDGDLTISGGFTWVGIVLVRGRATLTGGGSTKKIIGSIIVGEEVTSEGVGGEMTISGTIDIMYSTDAVTLASQSLIVPAMLMWRQGANP
jgi:hypothetical protein